MTEARRQWNEKNADKIRQWKRVSANKSYAANPAKFSDRAREWRKNNRQRVLERDSKYRIKYAEQRRAQFNAWRQKHSDYFKVRHDADVDALANWYVRAKLSRKTCIPPSGWPAPLVELMRAQLKLKRLLWQHQKTSKN